MANENPDFTSIMQQTQQVQSQMVKAQEMHAKQTLVGSAGGGKVQVLVDGNGEVVNVKIARSVVKPENVALLEDLFLAAARDAFNKVDELQESSLEKIGFGDFRI